MNHILLRYCAALLLLGLGMFWIKPAHAEDITCTASMTNVVFGSVDPQSSQTDANATLSYTCNNSKKEKHYVTICFSIDSGAQGAGQINPRQMQDGAGNILQFQLYQNASHSLVWGSQFAGGHPPYQANLTVPGNGVASGTQTMYGRVPGGQTAAVPGNYQDVFSGGNTAYTVKGDKKKFPDKCDKKSAGTFAFTATASVVKKCTITVSPLNFGNSVGLLTTAVNATTTLGVQCAKTTPYNVGLDAGQNSGGNINARKMVLGANSIGYQLYKDHGRTVVWGDTVGTNTVAGTGTGNTQGLTVYGKVPAQVTLPSGTYNDTIVVTVTY